MITIVDYGVGNIASLRNMLDYLGFDARTSSDPAEILTAKKLILPGVGAFDKAMRTLAEKDLITPIRTAATQLGTPILGICLGMQLLGRSSAEGELPGLGLIDADVVRITGGEMKVPHIGWAAVEPANDAPLLRGDDVEQRYYFVHSYHMRPACVEDAAGYIDYGQRLCVAVSRANIHGVQFHPEKSHRFGMKLMQRFAEIH